MSVLSDKYLLSHILSFLKVGRVISLQRVCSEWRDIISHCYFLQEFQEFNVGQYFGEYFYWKSNSSVVSSDGVGGAMVEREGEKKMVWRREKVSQLCNYLSDMKCKFNIACHVRVMNVLEDFMGCVPLIGNLCGVFPSVEIFRITFSSGNLDIILQVVGILAKNLKKLREIHIIFYRERMVDSEQEIEIRDSKQVTALEEIEKLLQSFPLVRVKVVDSLSIYTSNNWRLESTLDTVNEQKNDPLKEIHPNSYNFKEIFSSDEELLQLLQQNEWILKFQYRDINILIMALQLNFPNSVKFILEKQPATLYGYTYSAWKYVLSNEKQSLFMSLLNALLDLYGKSECFIREEIPFSISMKLNPLETICGNVSLIETANSVLGTRLFRDRLSKHQTGMSIHHYILTYLSEFEYLWNGIDLWDLDNEESILLANIFCSRPALFKKVTTEWNGFNDMLMNNYETVNSLHQNLLHKLFSNYGPETTSIYEKYHFLKEKCPNIVILLFQRDSFGRYPIDYLFSKHYYIAWCYEFVVELVNDMKLQNPCETRIIIKDTCLKREYFTVLYEFVRIMEGIDFLGVENLNFALFWNGIHSVREEHINHQYYYFLSKGYINVSSVNSKNQTLLHQIALSNIHHSCLYIMLVAFGCNIDAIDDEGCTVSHYSLSTNKKLLKKMGANPNILTRLTRYNLEQYSYPRYGWNLSIPTKKYVEQIVICHKCLKFFTSSSSLKKHNSRCK